jgi:integron integrase
LGDSSGESMSSGAGSSAEEVFWERYRRLVLGAGVEEGVAVWYRRHVEGFIRFIKPRRLRQANVADVSQYLLKMHRREDTEAWQVRQADKALRLMYQEMLNEKWAEEWAVPLPLPMEEVAESVPSAELGKKAVFAEWGQWEGSLERMVKAMRYLHYSYRTEQTYVDWAVRFVRTVREREPSGVGTAEVKGFLEELAVGAKVSASTQNQALNALVFYFREGLQRQFGELGDFERAKRSRRLPVVLTREEVRRVLGRMEGQYLLMGQLLYGGGLRLMECARLRVKDVDFEKCLITVRDGKGAKDRVTMLPGSAVEPLQKHLKAVRQQHEADVAAGYGDVYLPAGLARKWPNAGREWAWHWVFPSERLSVDPRGGKVRRHHVSDAGIQAAIKAAVWAAEVHKAASCHSLRHSFATHLL